MKLKKVIEDSTDYILAIFLMPFLIFIMFFSNLSFIGVIALINHISPNTIFPSFIRYFIRYIPLAFNLIGLLVIFSIQIKLINYFRGKEQTKK